MQLRLLAIPHFRNLRGVEIDFATRLSPMPGAPADALSHGRCGRARNSFDCISCSRLTVRWYSKTSFSPR